MNREGLWKQISQILKDLLPPEASVAVADEHQYLDYRPGQHDIHIEPGTEIPQGSISAQVVMQKSTISSLVDSSLFGVPYYGKGYPFHLENSWGAVTVILPPETPQPAPALLLPTQTLQTLSFVTGQSNHVWRPIRVEDIAYFESYAKQTWLHTHSSAYTTQHTLQALESQLPPSFIRIHRSYIVNISAIDSITRGIAAPLTVTLAYPADTHLSVSQSYVHEVRQRLGF